MATLDHLINDLRGEGSVESEGQFTLDREQAREKMQKFQLADARRYVLELVQAAVLRGATTIAFEIDADDMRVGFDGEVFTANELDDLYGSLFRDGEGPALEGLRQLALALNAAAGMNPKFISLRSGAVSLRMVPGKDDEITALEGDAAQAGTQIHVKQRLRPRILLDVFRNLRGTLGEETYLRERCGYARAAISLDGVAISHGPQAPEGSFGSIELEGEGYRVLMAAADSHPSTELRLVKAGVWIDSMELENAASSIVAVAEGDRLRKDVSQTKIVYDEELKHIVQAVRDARWQVWAEAKRAVAAGSDEFLQQRVPGLIESLILFFAHADAMREDPVGLELAEGVLWTDCRDPTREISLRALLELDPLSPIRWASERFLSLEADEVPILHMPDESRRSLLGRLIGEDRLVESDDLLHRARLREESRQAWLEREGDPVLPTHVQVLSSGPLDVKVGPLSLRGEVSIDRDTLTTYEHPVHMMLYKRRRLLGRLELDLDIPNVSLVVDTEFEPTDDYRDAVRNGVFVAALLRALAALRQPLARVLYEARGQLHEGRARRLAKRWLVSLLVPSAQAAMLASAGADVRPSFYTPPQELLPELLDYAPRRGEAESDCLVAQPLFRQLGDGPDLSLRELAARVEAEGKLEYLPEPPPDPRVEAGGVVVLGAGDRDIVRALFEASFGAGVLVERDISPELKRLRHSDQPPYRWRERLLPRLESSGVRAGVWHLEPRDLGVVLMLGCPDLGYELDDLDEDALSDAEIIALIDQREFCLFHVDLGWGPLTAVVDDPRVRANEQWDWVVEDEQLDSLIEELRVASHELFLKLCQHFERELSAVRRWLGRVLLHAVAAADARGEHWIPGSGFAKLPLFATVSGKHLSLEQVEAIAAAHGQVEVVERDTTWTPIDDPEILKLDPDEVEELGRLTDASFVEGMTRIRHRIAYESLGGRPRMEEAALDPAAVFAVDRLEGTHGPEGEVGISRTRREPGLNVRVGVAGRLVEEVEGHAHGVWLPIEAAVIDEELPLDASGDPDRSAKRYRALLRMLRRRAAPLIEDLCGRWEQLDAGEQAEVWRVLTMHLQAEAEVDRGAARDRVFERARHVAGFRDAWGRRYSLAQLQERGTKQPLRALGRVRPAVPKVEGPPVFLLSPGEIECLEDGFDFDVELIDDSWTEHIAWLESLGDAPKIERPNLRTQVLAYRKAQAAGGIMSELWIPLDYSPLAPQGPPPQIHVGLDGLAVASVSLLETLPCGGLLSGNGVALHADTVVLEERQRASLVRQLLIAYLELAEDLRGGKLDGERHTRGLEYMAWIDMCVDYGVNELEEINSDRKRARKLIRLASELTPPALRESLRRGLEDAEAEAEVAEQPKPEPEPEPQPAAEREVDEDELTVPVAAGASSTPSAEPLPVKALDPHQRLISAVYEQLHWARERHGRRLDELRLSNIDLRHLDNASVAEVHLTGIVLNSGHPIVERLLGQARHDLVDLHFVVAAVYSLMNYLAEEISDDDERLFVGQLAESLALALRAHGPG